MLSLTTGAPKDAWAGGALGDIERGLWPLQFGVLRFLGFQVLRPNVVYGPAQMDDVQRDQALERYRARLAALDDETPLSL